mmetsp:Transcript_16957/g.28268  ORF Transcript_16957/g.28268 Transcript_16957/m.28268 type:complete len:206 (+) Transcript_16957:287-904(+)
MLLCQRLLGGLQRNVCRSWCRDREVVAQGELAVRLPVLERDVDIDRRCGEVTLRPIELIRGETPRKLTLVELQHVHGAVACVPHRAKRIWRPSIQLHQDEAHREPVRHHDECVDRLVPRPQVDANHSVIPPCLRPIVDICAAFTGGEAIKEAANLRLLPPEVSKVVALQVAKFLLSDARLDVCVPHVFLNRKPQVARCLQGALKR